MKSLDARGGVRGLAHSAADLWRRMLDKDGGVESKLLVLGFAGLSLFLALGTTLFWVQHSMSASHHELVQGTLPAQQALGEMASSVGALFQRQAKMSSTQSTQQLEEVRDRSALESSLRQQIAQLGRHGSDLGQSRAAVDSLAALRGSVDQVLAVDQELFDSLARRHKTQAEFERELAKIDAGLRELVESTLAISGNLRLDYVMLLRQTADSLKSGVSAPLVRKIVLGPARGQQDAVLELGSAMTSFGWLVGKTGLAQDVDRLNSIIANEIKQNRARINKLLDLIGSQPLGSPEVAERLGAVRTKFTQIGAAVADEKLEQSLVNLRRQSLAEGLRALQIRERSLAVARTLDQNIEVLNSGAVQQAGAAQAAASATVWRSRLFSLIVCLIGLGICAAAAKRIRQSVQELRATNLQLTQLRDNLQHVNANLEGLVATRTQALVVRDRAMQLVLDSMSEGLLSADPAGNLLPERSKAAMTWFGKPKREGMPVWEYLFAPGDPNAEAFALGYAQLAEDIIPFDAAVLQMPLRFVRAGRSFQMDLRPALEDGRLTAVIIVISDVTARLEAERAERIAREEQQLTAQVLADKRGFRQSVRDCEDLLKVVTTDRNPVTVKRALHTLKGNCAVFGFRAMAEICHSVEANFEEAGRLNPSDRRRMEQTWKEALARVAVFTKNDDKLEIEPVDYFNLRKLVDGGGDRAAVLAVLDDWQLEATSGALHRLVAQAQRIATQLGKAVEVSTEDNRLRLPPEQFHEFWSNMVHAIRNAVDHGIETKAERLAAGKSAAGKLRLATRLDERGKFMVEIADDGRGIDFEQIRLVALQRGLPASTPEELIAAMLADGVSSKTEVTEISGRGVGTSALKQACESLGGVLRVESKAGRGTKFIFEFPSGSPKPAPPRAIV